MRTHLQSIAHHNGVLAVFLTDGGETHVMTSNNGSAQAWSAEFLGATKLLRLVGEDRMAPRLRVTFSARTLVLEQSRGIVMGALIPTGHAVGKSLRRMMRRTFRRIHAGAATPAPASVLPSDL